MTANQYYERGYALLTYSVNFEVEHNFQYKNKSFTLPSNQVRDKLVHEDGFALLPAIYLDGMS